MMLFSTVSAFAAEDCPRGDLDKGYCDRDGDMLADLPADKDEWLDPSTIIFSYTPVEDPAVWAGIWDRFLQHFRDVVGRKVVFFQVQNYAAQLEALRAGRLHVAGVNAGSTPIAVNCAGFVPVAQMATPAGPWGYDMEIIVPAGSPIQTVEELRGKNIAFVSPTSTSGYKAPVQILETEFGLKLDRDYTSRFTGKHDTSIMGVSNNDYEAAAVAGDLARRMADRNVLDLKTIRTIYKSELFPGTAYGVINRLNPDLRAKIVEAFVTYDWKDPKLMNEFPDVDRFIPIDYKDRFAIIRRIDAKSGVKYDCR